MKNYLTSLVLISLSIALFGQSKDEKAIQKSFAQYKSAILNSDGEEAYKWVDYQTKEFYSSVVEDAIYSDSSEIVKQGFMKKFMILVVRNRIPKEQLIQMTGQDLFVYAVNEEMISKNSVSQVEIENIKVDGNYALGEVSVDGNPGGFSFRFYETDEWRIDLTSVFSVSSSGIQQAIKDKGISDEEFILYSIEMSSGQKLDRGIWEPLKEKGIE